MHSHTKRCGKRIRLPAVRIMSVQETEQENIFVKRKKQSKKQLQVQALFSSQKFSRFSITSNLWSHAWSTK